MDMHFILSLIIKRKLIGIVGIASAADFTSRMENLHSSEHEKYLDNKEIKVHSKYSKHPYVFKKKFIDNSKKYFLINKRIKIRTKSIFTLWIKR